MARPISKRADVVQPQDVSIRYIPLTRGQVAIVDASDYEWLSRWIWFAYWSPSSKSFYAKRSEKRADGRWTQIYMQTQILDPKGGNICDHISRDTLDNRRANLRGATRQQNGCNRGAQANSRLGVKGVRMKRGRFAAQIQVRGKAISLGSHGSLDQAKAAYAAGAEKYHGEFARAA